MLTQNLFSKILMDPAQGGADTLYIVSGYASSAMTFHHFEELKKQSLVPKINLLIGMVIHDGLPNSNHRAFQKLMSHDLKDRFNCYYLAKKPQAHSKIYTWFQQDRPSTAFIGSANYSQNAFIGRQREIMDMCDPKDSLDYYHSLLDEAIPCTHKYADDLVYSSKRKKTQTKNTIPNKEAIRLNPKYIGLKSIEVFIAKCSINF